MEDIPDQGARGFDFGEGAHHLGVFVVRTGAHIRAYVNVCPHMGTPLEFIPDRFLTADQKHILCTTHGAQFQILDGLCISGPCKNQSLTPLSITLTDGDIQIA